MSSEGFLSGVGSPGDLSLRTHRLYQTGLCHPKRLWVLTYAERNPWVAEAPVSDNPACLSELCELAFAILIQALRARVAQAKFRLHARLSRQAESLFDLRVPTFLKSSCALPKRVPE